MFFFIIIIYITSKEISIFIDGIVNFGREIKDAAATVKWTIFCYKRIDIVIINILGRELTMLIFAILVSFFFFN